jgi:type I restriction enzyme S subunit
MEYVTFESLLSVPLRNGLSKPQAIRGEGIKMIGMKEIFQYDRIYTIDSERVPTTDSELSNCLLKKNDLLFARQSLSLAGAGKCAIVMQLDEDTVYESHLIRARLVDDVVPMYYYYFFRSPQGKQKMSSIVQQVAAAGIRGSNLLKLQVPVPSYEKQSKISKILSTFDSKIEENIKYIATLNCYIITIYLNWFSDFNYHDATGEMRKSENLHIEVPRDWKEMKFGEFLSSFSEKIGDTEAPVYSTTNNGIALRDDKFNKNLSKSQNNNKKIVKDDLIFGLSRGILNFGVVTADIGSVSPVYQIFKIDQAIFLPFMLELEIRINMQNYMDILQLGAREGQGISKDYLLNKYILVPDMKVQKRFEEIYIAIQNKISQLKDENTVLAEIRDTLLPKLMSGELQVEAGED